MANIKTYLDKILQAIRGEEVRGSIHDSIEKINNEVIENTTLSNDVKTRQDLLEKKYDEQIKNIAASEPQNAEIVDARGGFSTLGGIIKQKVYHFENVEEMKNCLTLNSGDVVETLGYYEKNDGGAGTYQIVDDSTLTADGGSVHDLENGLKAKLICREYVNVDQFGAIGNGVTDDTKAIQNAINYIAEKGIVNFNKDKNYIVSSTIFIKNGMKLNFNYCKITPILGGNFINNYLFSINSSDASTWDVAYSSDFVEINDFVSDNINLIENLKAFYICASVKFKNFKTRRYFASIITGNYYLDLFNLDNVIIIDNMSEEYAIQKNGQGDGVIINAIHSLAYRGDANRNLLKVGATRGMTINNAINGNYYFYNSQKVSINNSHIEKGKFKIVNSQLNFNNCYLWKDNDTAKIQIIDVQTEVLGNINLPVVLNECTFILRYSDYQYSSDIEDIDISKFAGELHINNTYRQCTLDGSSYEYASLTGIQIKIDEDNSIYTTSSKNIIRNKRLINNSLLVNRVGDAYNLLSSVRTITDKKTTWKAEKKTYYYTCGIMLNQERKIGSINSSVNTVKNVTVDDDISSVKMTVSSEISSCPFLLIYRGSANNIFEQYVIIPNPNSRVLIDTGEDINGYVWKDNTETDLSKMKLNLVVDAVENKDTIKVHMKSIPTAGNWKVGDIVYNTNPVAGGTVGWICTEAGMPGTWKKFGTIES